MRFPSLFSTGAFVFSVIRTRLPPQARLARPQALVLRSMPTIPFLGSLFGTSTPASSKMSYPDQRSNDEWQAVLNKGELTRETCGGNN